MSLFSSWVGWVASFSCVWGQGEAEGLWDLRLGSAPGAASLSSASSWKKEMSPVRQGHRTRRRVSGVPPDKDTEPGEGCPEVEQEQPQPWHLLGGSLGFGFGLSFAFTFALRSLGQGREAAAHPGHLFADFLELLIDHPLSRWGVSLSIYLCTFSHGWMSPLGQTNAWRQVCPRRPNLRV